jgi:hypothetical protein
MPLKACEFVLLSRAISVAAHSCLCSASFVSAQTPCCHLGCVARKTLPITERPQSSVRSLMLPFDDAGNARPPEARLFRHDLTTVFPPLVVHLQVPFHRQDIPHTDATARQVHASAALRKAGVDTLGCHTRGAWRPAGVRVVQARRRRCGVSEGAGSSPEFSRRSLFCCRRCAARLPTRFVLPRMAWTCHARTLLTQRARRLTLAFGSLPTECRLVGRVVDWSFGCFAE